MIRAARYPGSNSLPIQNAYFESTGALFALTISPDFGLSCQGSWSNGM